MAGVRALDDSPETGTRSAVKQPGLRVRARQLCARSLACFSLCIHSMHRPLDDVTIRHLARVVESSDDAIVSKDLNGIITSWNRAAERMFGYTAAEAVGQSIRMIIPADRQSEEDMVLARIRAGAGDHAFRDDPPAEGRHADPDFADRLADSRRRRPGDRRVEDRARHQRTRAGRSGHAAGSRRSSNRRTTRSSPRI